jgi:hypothetical protein
MPASIFRPMRRIALWVRESQIKKLKRLAAETGAPMAELIRRAVDQYLDARKAESLVGQKAKAVSAERSGQR